MLRFTITFSMNRSRDELESAEVLFAKGPKLSGHFEVWLNYGMLCFYAPDMNDNESIYTGIDISDGNDHRISICYNTALLYVIIDSKEKYRTYTHGDIKDSSFKLTAGSLEDGTFAYKGRVSDICISENCDMKFSRTEKKPLPDFTPKSMKADSIQTGSSRLMYPQCLPILSSTVSTGYEGSISKCGDNADWDWYMYQLENGEWVLLDVSGAGCIYNITQHRYPTSEEPIFRFYFDNEAEPSFSIRQSEFGHKYPLISPLSDIYEGPYDNGRGPIWVIRSFVPMQFRSRCIVTSSVKLTGYDKAKGEGGWGHITYSMYENADGIEAFSQYSDISYLADIAKNAGADPKALPESYSKTQFKETEIILEENSKQEVFKSEKAGAILSVKLDILDICQSVLSDVHIRMVWDDQETCIVDAPIGTFFGNEYALSSCDHRMITVGMRLLIGEYVSCYNYFPMPFWKNAVIEVYNTGNRAFHVNTCIGYTSYVYDKSISGYFASSPYYPKTANILGQNSVIADIEGSGCMVYGVLSGYGISCGCEGDVRVFIDGKHTPSVESDGSESWASYGWGFVTPPQCNPFSAYNGRYGSNSYWSETRLTYGDSYWFGSSLRFELEHGCCNDGGGFHSGQIFMYMAPDGLKTKVQTDIVEGSYTSDCSYTQYDLISCYENGTSNQTLNAPVRDSFTGSVSFRIHLRADNIGCILTRRSSQEKGRQMAKVYVDGELVTERIWLQADSNDICKWLDDDFMIPAKYVKNKDSALITIEPIKNWSESQYIVYSIR